jgi:hypothetical protein
MQFQDDECTLKDLQAKLIQADMENVLSLLAMARHIVVEFTSMCKSV